MKIFLAVISVVLLASVVQANLLGGLTAIFQCGQQNAGNASVATTITAASKLSQMGAKCQKNELGGLNGLLQCTGTTVLQLVAQLTTALPNALLGIVSGIPIIGDLLGSLLGGPVSMLMKTLGPLLKPVFELLASLLEIPGVLGCVFKAAPDACSTMGSIPGLGDKLKCP